jgi:hypothetical protein
MFIPVPAVPVRGPQVSLLSSSVTPTNEQDIYALDGVGLPLLADEVKVELEAMKGEAWTRGFSYWPESGRAVLTRAPNDVSTTMTPDLTKNLPVVQVQPWLAVAELDASTFGNPAIDYVGRATRRLEAATPAAIEQEFWDGTLAQANLWPNFYLRKAAGCTDVTPVVGTPVSVNEGLALLQEALADTSVGLGGQGMIHTSLRTIPNYLYLRSVGKLLLDLVGNIVIPGVGYSGGGPIGATTPTGSSWLFGTDLIMTRVAQDIKVVPDSMAEAVDRGEGGNPNLVTFRAQRTVCAYGDSFRHFAVLVTIPTT